MELAQIDPAREMVQAILAKNVVKTCCVVLMCVWWDTHNKVNAGKPMRSVDSVCHRIQRSLLYCANLMGSKEVKQAQRQQEWLPPAGDLLKILMVIHHMTVQMVVMASSFMEAKVRLLPLVLAIYPMS